MSRAYAGGCFALGLAMVGCAGEAPRHEVTPPPLATTDAVTAAPTTTASASASTTADALTPPPRTRVDMSAALARLPKDAAVYGLFRPVAGDTLVDWAKNPEGARREFRRLVPSGTFLELVSTLGVDPAVPVAFAVLGPDLGESRKLMDALMGAAKPSRVKADMVDITLGTAAANGTLIRFVMRPTTPERDTLAELERISEKARMRFVRCPDAPQCAFFTGEKPLGVIDRGNTAVAFYKQAGMLEVDWLEGRLGTSDARAKALAGRRALTGGPAAVCSKLDSEADLSFCVDGTRAGDLGAATGLAAASTAVRGVETSMRGKILQQGKKEALVNITLASPRRKLLDDGTLSISIAKNGYTAVGSWLLTEASTASVQASLARETCAGPKRVAADLVPALQKAFGDAGSDFKDLKQRRDDFRDAGFGSTLIAFARIWPNMLGSVKEEVELGPLSYNRVCARAVADRLELRMDGPPLDVDRL
jgi:hypothetical protein